MLQHGLFQNSENWVFEGQNSLAIQLLDMGFDVWLGNNRGNIYSRFNLKLSPSSDDEKFWDFSFFEMGQYDLPAMIGGILSELPSYNKLTYIGYSQGTSQMFTALSYNYGDL